MFHIVADAQATAHCGNLMVELLPGDLMVKAQPAELDLHTEKVEKIIIYYIIFDKTVSVGVGSMLAVY